MKNLYFSAFIFNRVCFFFFFLFFCYFFISVLCRNEISLVTDVFPIVKRFSVNKFNEHILRTSSRHAPITYLHMLQFCLDFNEVTTLFDIEPRRSMIFFLKAFYKKKKKKKKKKK
jgi:hypothetical protein